MSSTVQKLTEAGVINPPNDVKSNTMYETVVGSVAYGVANDASDYDVNGFFIPKAENLFPHLRGHLLGFDKEVKCPKCWQNHHITHPTFTKEYDLNIYSITQYFRLCLDNNPNMVDTLYTPRECVLHSTNVSEMVRERRDLFLHKRCWPKYKGYAYQQLTKMRTKQPEPGTKRFDSVQEFGYDVKFAYHLVRLLLEAEMIMDEHCIDIRRHKEHLKAIRTGQVAMIDIERWAENKERHLEASFESSTLRAEPATEEVKQLLIDCLEHHYGSLSALEPAKQSMRSQEMALEKIRDICEKNL